jgi:hypothetical protein
MGMTVPPYTIAVLGPFWPGDEERFGGGLEEADVSALDSLLEKARPSWVIPLGAGLVAGDRVVVKAGRMKDFRPEQVVKTTPCLADLAGAIGYLKEAEAARPPLAEAVGRARERWPGALLPQPEPEASRPEQAAETDLLDGILAKVDLGQGGAGQTRIQYREALETRLAEIARLIYENEGWRQGEAAWRGLSLMLKAGRVKGPGRARVAVGCLPRDWTGAAAAQTERALLRLSPQLIVLDWKAANTPEGLESLGRICGMAEGLCAPVAVEVDAGFWGLKSWKELGRLPAIPGHIEGLAYAKWRRFRETDGARWLVPLLGRVAARYPYGPGYGPEPVLFEESGPLWVSPVWAFAALAAQSVGKTGWPGRITERAGALLEELPAGDFGAESAMSGELALSGDRAEEFCRAGFTPVVGRPGRDTAGIPLAATARGNSLEYQLALARAVQFFTHANAERRAELSRGDLGANLREAFLVFFKEYGVAPPGDLDIRVEEGAGGRAEVGVGFTFPSEIVPGRARAEFGMEW